MSRTPIHPGTISGEELAEIGISAAELARQLKIPTNRITQIIAGRRNVTADTALRLGKWFGTSAVFWLNLQKSYEQASCAKENRESVKKRFLPVTTNGAGYVTKKPGFDIRVNLAHYQAALLAWAVPGLSGG